MGYQVQDLLVYIRTLTADRDEKWGVGGQEVEGHHLMEHCKFL